MAPASGAAGAKIAALGALCGAAAVCAVLLSSRQSPSALLNAATDLDAPTFQDLAFVKTKGRSGHVALASQNRRLKGQVKTLEQEVQTLSKDLSSRFSAAAPRAAVNRPRAAAPRAPTQGLHGMQKRMEWARQAMKKPWQQQMLAKKRGLAHEVDVESAYYSTSAGDPMGTALSTEAGDDNFVAALQPGDYWKDPYERPFLHAPGPHDPTSSLAHTVTGDYASPATWGEIYHDKESIDWCTENFAWYEDRIKCISKLHAQGPLLG